MLVKQPHGAGGEPAAAAPGTRDADAAAGEPPAPGAPVRVLVVDDIADILDYFRGVFRHIRNLPFDLTIENDGQAALRLAGEEAFDLIVTDFRMVGVDGIQILKKAKERHPDGLRVLMTGYNEIPAKVEEIRAAGVDAYLQKPLAAQELLLLLHDLLTRNQATLAALREKARGVEESAAHEERAHAPRTTNG